MKAVHGKVILTINNHPEMRAIFNEFKMETTKINYTVGGTGTENNRMELIVMNW